MGQVLNRLERLDGQEGLRLWQSAFGQTTEYNERPTGEVVDQI